MRAKPLLRFGWLTALVVALPAALAQNMPASASASVSASNGASVYHAYCENCHDARGDGAGAAARLFKPPPADLTRSTKPDEYKTLIIRLGGEPMGRSPGMPPWGQELSETQIHEVVAYLRSVVKAR
jgi:mono/diheme cytochrome c family protein